MAKNIQFKVTQYTGLTAPSGAGDWKRDERMKPFRKDVENLIGYCEESVHGMATVIKSSLPLFKESKEIGQGEYDRLKNIMEDNPNVEPTLGVDARIDNVIERARQDFHYDMVLREASKHFLKYYEDEVKRYFGLIEKEDADDENKAINKDKQMADLETTDPQRCKICGEDDFANKEDFDAHENMCKSSEVRMDDKEVTIDNGRRTDADFENSVLRDDVGVMAQKNDEKSIARYSLEKFTQVCSELLTGDEYSKVSKRLDKYFNKLTKEQTSSVELATFIDSRYSAIIDDSGNRFVFIKDVLEEMEKHRSTKATKSDNGKASSSGRKVIPAPTVDKEDTREKTEEKDADEIQSKDSPAMPNNKRRREIDEKACDDSLMVMKKKRGDEKNTRGKPVEVLKEKVGKSNSNDKELEEANDKDAERDTTSKDIKHAGRMSSDMKHTYSCDKCPFKGKNKNSLTSHRRQIHGIMHKCEECEYETKTLRYLTLHQNTHAPGQQFECGIEECLKKFRHNTSLTRHKTSVHGSGGNNKCEKCKRIFALKANLGRHLRRIHNEGSYKKRTYHCNSCSYVTDRSYCLTKHIEKNHKK